MQSEGGTSPPPQPSILRWLSHIPLFTLELFNTLLTFLCFLLQGPANGILPKKTSEENVTRLSHFSERVLRVRSILLLSL
jgi:hypothetical protein